MNYTFLKKPCRHTHTHVRTHTHTHTRTVLFYLNNSYVYRATVSAALPQTTDLSTLSNSIISIKNTPSIKSDLTNTNANNQPPEDPDQHLSSDMISNPTNQRNKTNDTEEREIYQTDLKSGLS